MLEIERSRSSNLGQIPDWAWQVLSAPDGGPLRCERDVLWAADQAIGRIDQGILHFDVPSGDPSTDYYRTIGGAHFHERSSVSYAMTALDTPVYHDYLRNLVPDDHNSLIIDIGGGDGRNALP